VVFDLAEWQRRPNAPEAWTIAVEEVDLPADGPLGNREHGTAVVVRQLRQKDPLPGAVLQKLGEAFKPHLEGDDSIVVNGDPATPYNYDFVPNSIVPIDLAFGAPDQYRITGWVAIDKQTHNAGDYGFNIYRHGQLVETWYQGWFAAHLMTSRIIGEVHMDFIEATFFKQGLQQSELWRQASAEMKEFMKPVVRASQDLSRKGNVNSPVIAQGIVNDMYRGVGLDPPDTNEPVDEGDSPTGGPTTGESKHELPRLHVNLESLVLEDGTCVSISLVEKAFPTSGTPFDFVFSSAGRSLQAVLNTNHPLHQKSRDVEQLRTLAIADCILRYLVRECAMTGDKAAEIRNIWILAAMGVSTQRGCD